MKNIYDKLNDFEISVDEVELNDFEKAKMLETAKSYSKVKNNFPKYLGLVAAILLLVAISIPGVRAATVDLAMQIKVSVMETFGFSEKANEYLIESNEKIFLGDRSFILKDLAIDENKVYTNVLFASADFDFPNLMPDLENVIVGNKKYTLVTGRGFAGERYHDGLMLLSLVNIYDEDIDLTDAATIELGFSDGENFTNLTIAAPKNNISEVSINLLENYKIQKTDGYVIDYIRANPLGVSAKVTGPETENSLKLIGVDSLGSEFILEKVAKFENVTEFLYDNDHSDVDLNYFLDNYKDFSFALYELVVKDGVVQPPNQYIKISESISLSDN